MCRHASLNNGKFREIRSKTKAAPTLYRTGPEFCKSGSANSRLSLSYWTQVYSLTLIPCSLIHNTAAIDTRVISWSYVNSDGPRSVHRVTSLRVKWRRVVFSCFVNREMSACWSPKRRAKSFRQIWTQFVVVRILMCQFFCLQNSDGSTLEQGVP